MDTCKFEKIADHARQIPETGAMRVPAVIYADEALLTAMDNKVHQ